MAYKKFIISAVVIAIIAATVSGVVFGTTDIKTNDKIMDKTLDILIFIQKYSWPVVTLVFIYALYEFYVAGAEILESKILGQRLIIGIAVFMAIIQCLPLFYAFMTVK